MRVVIVILLLSLGSCCRPPADEMALQTAAVHAQMVENLHALDSSYALLLDNLADTTTTALDPMPEFPSISFPGSGHALFEQSYESLVDRYGSNWANLHATARDTMLTDSARIATFLELSNRFAVFADSLKNAISEMDLGAGDRN